MDLDCKLVYDQEKVIFDFFQIFSGCKDESYGAGGRVGDSDTRKAKCTLRSELKGATPNVRSYVIVGNCKYSYANVRKIYMSVAVLVTFRLKKLPTKDFNKKRRCLKSIGPDRKNEGRGG